MLRPLPTRKDLNFEPPGLESGALPIRATGWYIKRARARFTIRAISRVIILIATAFHVSIVLFSLCARLTRSNLTQPLQQPLHLKPACIITQNIYKLLRRGSDEFYSPSRLYSDWSVRTKISSLVLDISNTANPLQSDSYTRTTK